MGEGPFIGTEALASGRLTWHELGHYYTAIMPNIYFDRHRTPSLEERTVAAWLWSGRRAVIAGSAAAALHGSKWVDGDVIVELIWPNARAPKGVKTRADRLLVGEIALAGGLPVTTVERTAFDLGRRGPLGLVVGKLDALANATNFKISDVADLAGRHPHTRGLRQLEAALDLVDAGAQSPKETWLRLLLINSGFPRPQTQIPVPGPDGYPKYFLDMGYADIMLAIEYDGDQHRTYRPQYVRDVTRLEYIRAAGWTHITVLREHRGLDVIHRVRAAWDMLTLR